MGRTGKRDEGSLFAAAAKRAAKKVEAKDPVEASFDKFLGTDRPERPEPKRRSSSVAPKRRAQAHAEMLALAKTEEWSKWKSLHFVALFCELHTRVYGFASSELNDSKAYAYAAFAAARLCKDSFGGDAEKFVGFVRWVWKREKEREDWRRKNGRGGNVLSWRWVFSKRTYDEWRADAVRTRERSNDAAQRASGSR